MVLSNTSKRHKNIISSYCKLVHANILEENGVLNITFPESLEKKFGQTNIKICYDKNLAKKNRLEYIQPGSNFLEKIYQECFNYGNVSIYRLKDSHKSSIFDIQKSLEFANCQVESQGSFPNIKYACMFIFQISYNIQEYTPQQKNITIDAKTFEYLDWLTIDLPFEEHVEITNRPKIITKKNIYTAYNKSLDYLKNLLTKEFNIIEFENQKKLQQESTRIKRYYRNLKDEETKRIEKIRYQLYRIENKLNHHKTLNTFLKYHETKKKLLKKIDRETSKLYSYNKKIDSFEKKEFEKIQKKYDPECEINLISIVIIQYIQIRFRFLLFNTNLQTKLDIYYVPSASKIYYPKCSICQKEMTQLFLHLKSNIICNQCKNNLTKKKHH